MDRGAWRATVHEVARVRDDVETKPPPPPPPPFNFPIYLCTLAIRKDFFISLCIPCFLPLEKYLPLMVIRGTHAGCDGYI